jgi:aspartate oxidase
MSTVVVLAPVIIANWPIITAAVTAAVASAGFAVARDATAESASRTAETNRAEIELEDSEILQTAAGSGQELVVEREGLRATFSRDARGGLKVCMEGAGYSKRQLEEIGQDLIDRVTQQYVYHRVVTELKQRNLAIVDEQVAEDRTVKIRVRSW